jgi:hypothetical protein
VEQSSSRTASHSTPLQQVMEELGQVVASPTKAQWEKAKVLSQTLTLPPQTSFDNWLKAGLNTPDDDVRSMIMIVLIRRNDVSTLPSVQELLLSGSYSKERKQGIVTAIGHLSNPEALPTLKSFIRSNEVAVRKAAARGLGQIGDASSVPLLISALDDSDEAVRHQAVLSLGLITGQSEWICSEREFQQNGHKYVQHWREWASRRDQK